jgi:inhibitor of cysteine peptidase
LSVAGALLLALGLAACGGSGSGGSSASPTPASPSASPTAAAQIVKVEAVGVPPATNVKVGDTLVVTLNSNATTGYQWTVQGSGISDTGVLKQVGKAKVLPPKSDLMGAPSKTQFTFQAVKKGSDQLEFWYARPSDPGQPGASYALIVNVGKGHLPVTVTATEDYTAETAQIRTGDTLEVEIRNAAATGKAAWKVAASTAPVQLRTQKWSSGNGGTVMLKFTGTATGSGALVLVNQPPGDVPLQTYALPVSVKAPQKPITVQLTKHDDGEDLAVKAGDIIQVTLPDQPSTDFAWEFQKPNAKVLKQVGQPAFTPNNDTIGAKGKTTWTFKVAGPGKAPLIADYNQVPAEAMPMKTFQVNVAAKPGYRPKTFEAVASYPSETMSVKPGDVIVLELAAKAGTWVPQGSSKHLTNSPPSSSGGKTVVAYTARSAGVVTSLLLAAGTQSLPDQAYAFTTVVGKGKAPATISAVERRAAKPVTMKVGETLTVQLPGNPTTGYQWVTDEYVGAAVLEQVGTPTFTANSELMGAPGVFSVTFKATAPGSQPLTFLYEGPADGTSPDGIYMTWVTVE